MQDFLRPHPLGEGIQRGGEIRTSAADGRVGWIDVEDVAEAAAVLLSDPEFVADDAYQLTGPQGAGHPPAEQLYGQLMPDSQLASHRR